MFYIFFCILLTYSNFLDPYELDKEDLANEKDDKNPSVQAPTTGSIQTPLASERTASKIKTEDLLFWPEYFYNNINYGIGGSIFYSYSYISEKNNSIPSLIAASIIVGSNDYFNSNLIFDTFWNENKNNFIINFDTLMLYSSYYNIGFNDPSFVNNYDMLDFNLELNYRRKYKNLYFGISYLLKSKSLELDAVSTSSSLIDKPNLFLLGFKLGVDNIPCKNIIYKTGYFLYGLYYSSYNTFMGSDKNLNSIEFNIEKTFLLSSLNKFIVKYDFNTYLEDKVTYLALFSPNNLLRPYSKYKYLDKEYMAIDFDLRILLAKNTFLSINAAAFQTRDDISKFLLNDFMYSYGFGLLFPFSKNLNARIDYSINKDEKNIYIGLSN